MHLNQCIFSFAFHFVQRAAVRCVFPSNFVLLDFFLIKCQMEGYATAQHNETNVAILSHGYLNVVDHLRHTHTCCIKQPEI